MLILIFGATEERALIQFRKVRANIDPSAKDELIGFYKNDKDTIIANSEDSAIKVLSRGHKVYADTQCTIRYYEAVISRMVRTAGTIEFFE